jgi:hypothetical protein
MKTFLMATLAVSGLAAVGCSGGLAFLGGWALVLAGEGLAMVIKGQV